MNDAEIVANCSNNDMTLMSKHSHSVSGKQIRDVIHRLRSSKSHGDCTDHLLTALSGSVRFYSLISLLFTNNYVIS